MGKKDYPSREEHEVWQYLQEKEIVDTGLVSDIFPEMAAGKRNKILHSLHRKGYLRRARNGLYYNPERLTDFHRLALRIKPGYIGLGSALRHYNLIEYEDFTIFVMTRSFRKKVSLEGTKYEIQFIPLGNLFTGFETKDGVCISSPEKTFFDCLLKPGLIGFATITKALSASKLDWHRFISFFRMTGNCALHQRTGYLLELMKKNTSMDIPPFVFEFLEKKVKNTVRLTSAGSASTFSRRWKLQDNVGERNILSWWY